MTTKQLEAALVLAKEKEQLEQRISELDADIHAALNGQMPSSKPSQDKPAWVRGPLDAKVFNFLKVRGQASVTEIANHLKTTSGNVSNWITRRKNFLTNPTHGQWALK